MRATLGSVEQPSLNLRGKPEKKINSGQRPTSSRFLYPGHLCGSGSNPEELAGGEERYIHLKIEDKTTYNASLYIFTQMNISQSSMSLFKVKDPHKILTHLELYRRTSRIDNFISKQT